MPHAALCVSRPENDSLVERILAVSMPHAALCVSRQQTLSKRAHEISRFNAARSIVCVETRRSYHDGSEHWRFQCRTQHCVCRDRGTAEGKPREGSVSMPHAALCVSRLKCVHLFWVKHICFNAARSIVCVETGRMGA